MHRQNRSNNLFDWFELPTLPFLSIMLGLMSVMSLASIGMAVQKRQEEKKQTLVTLVEVPNDSVPIHIRCQKDMLLWQDSNGRWNELYLGGEHGRAVQPRATDVGRFITFIQEHVRASRKLSYQGKQHSVILWIESEGVMTAYEVQRIFQEFEIPLRIGKLPVMGEETIVSPTSK